MTRYLPSALCALRVVIVPIVLLALLAAIGQAQAPTVPAAWRGAIDGRVEDPAGTAIIGAQITLLPIGRRTQSDDGGRYEFDDLAAGGYIIQVRRIGYRPSSQEVTVGVDRVRVRITLEPIAAVLDSVVIRERASGIRLSMLVLDDANTPVRDADVMAAGIDNTIRTDSLGRFTLPGLKRGTVMVRVRKLGYQPWFGALRMLAEREDTVRLPRLSQQLSAVEINERSGFGMDVWAFKDLDQRTRWRGTGAGAISREELDEQGRAPLCAALPSTPTGARLGIGVSLCGVPPVCVLIDGRTPLFRSLTAIFADEVESVEYYPRPEKTDLSGNLAARRCGSYVPNWIIWMRTDRSVRRP